MRLYSTQVARALAAILVVVAHDYNHPLEDHLLAAARIGRFGVVLFFVISGFIMVHTTGSGAFDPAAFLKRRIVRIVPYYWLVTLAVAGVALLAPSLLKTTVYSTSHLVLSLLFIPHVDPVGSTDPILKLGWTLNYEMFFYVVFALLFAFGAWTRMIAITVVFAAVAAYGLLVYGEQEALPRFNGSGIGFPLYSDAIILAFALGGLLGCARLSGRLAPARGTGLLLVSVAVGLLALALVVEPGERGGLATNAALTLASGLIVAGGLAFEPEARDFRLGRLLGDASFSIYLTHMYWIGLCWAVASRLGIGTGPYFAVAVSGAIVGGVVAYRLVERPLLRLVGGDRPKRRAPFPAGPEPARAVVAEKA